MTRQSVAFADEIVAVMQAMRTEESRLLEERTEAARSHFIFAIVVLIISFSAAVLLLFWHYRLLRDELHARERAEQTASQEAAAAIDAEHKARQSENAAIASTNKLAITTNPITRHSTGRSLTKVSSFRFHVSS